MRWCAVLPARRIAASAATASKSVQTQQQSQNSVQRSSRRKAECMSLHASLWPCDRDRKRLNSTTAAWRHSSILSLGAVTHSTAQHSTPQHSTASTALGRLCAQALSNRPGMTAAARARAQLPKLQTQASCAGHAPAANGTNSHAGATHTHTLTIAPPNRTHLQFAPPNKPHLHSMQSSAPAI